MFLITEGKINVQYVLIVVVLAVIVGGGILAWQFLLAPKGETPASTPERIQEPEQAQEPEPTFPEMVILPIAGSCGSIRQASLRDADYSALLNESCDLGLIEQRDERFLELKHYISSPGPNMADAAQLFFDVAGAVDPSKIVSSKIYLENVFCSGSVMIRYTSNEAYKKLAYYGAAPGDFTFNCGQGTPRNIQTIELDSDVIEGGTIVVIGPYSTVYPFQVDKIYLKVQYQP